MKILSQHTVTHKIETTIVELKDGRNVKVVNFINEKGKVDDTFMEFEDTGESLEHEGEEGQLREDIEALVEKYVEEQEKSKP